MSPRLRRLNYLLAGAFHRLAWAEWGPESGSPVICVHGLTRCGRDFDPLAKALAARGRRVFCPDLPGRGESDCLRDPMLYTPPNYVIALAHLLARLDGPVEWVGTSLGGICGMLVAGSGPGQPISRLVLNDVGSRIPDAAADRIAAYVKTPLAFHDIEALEAHLRLVHAPFGPLTDSQWRHLATYSARALEDGRFGMHYDPAIAVPFEEAAPGLDLTDVWARVTVPTLLLRGEASDILEAETAEEMARRPGVELVSLPGIGHAPALMEPSQIARVADFLEARG